MTEQQRLFIGRDYGTGARVVPFLGNHNIHEANLIFWHPPSLLEELAPHGKLIPPSMKALLEQKMTALSEWVQQGHTLIVVGTHSLSFRYQDAVGQHKVFRLESLAPLKEVAFVAASGSRIEFCGPPRMKDVFSNLLPRMTYQCLMSGSNLEPLLRVAAATTGAVQIVGGYRQLGFGTVFYVPPFSGTPEASNALINELAKLPACLKSTPAELLDWVNAYKSAPERETKEKIVDLERSVTELKVQITQEEANLAEHEALKHLLCATGTAFANAVAAALTELSFIVVEGPHPRADLLSARKDRFIAIEAKGLEGPAKEAHFRQVERWTAEVNSTLGQPPEEVNRDPDLRRYFAQLSKLGLHFPAVTEDCKGVMIIGTFRTTSLADRLEPDFPDPVLRLLSRSNVCALTGLQLFTLVMQIREDPELKGEIVEEIVNTCGVLARGYNWTQYIEGPQD
jgi:hypothetical protein